MTVVTAGCGRLRDKEPTTNEKWHGELWLDAGSAEFHGKVLRDGGYDYSQCRTCHGADLDGGIAGVACASCHTEGAAGCTLCHAQPPATGAHLKHLDGGALGRAVTCETCHTVPTSGLFSVGHLDTTPGAEVPFADGGIAYTKGAVPRYDAGKCSNAYCHGATLADGGNTTPTWTGGSAEVACGTCHSVPLSGHFTDPCSACHGDVVDSNRNIINPTLHINGVADVRYGP